MLIGTVVDCVRSKMFFAQPAVRRFSGSMLHTVQKFQVCVHLFIYLFLFVLVQEGAGSLRPVQLHHGGGCPSGTAFL